MASVNFYLKKPEGTPPRSLIYLQFKYNKKRLVYSFGQTIDPTKNKPAKNKEPEYLHWDVDKQRVKSNKVTTKDGKYSLNDLLNNLEQLLLRAYNEVLADGTPPVSVLKDRLDAFMDKNEGKGADPKIYELFDRFISGEIKKRGGKDKAAHTLKNYNTTKSHLKAFDTKTRFGVSFDNINLDFFHKYTNFLKNDLRLKHNTIAKDITTLKTVMGEAVDLGFTSNALFRHKKFSFSEEEVDAVYLTEKEIISLYRFDLSKNRRLEQVKDLFVFGCFTGLRYSDYSNIRPENIVDIDGDLFIKMITQKTGELVVIPCNPIIMEIFQKYKDNPNRLPKAISNQKFNEYLKKGNAKKKEMGVCQLAGMTAKGRLTSDPDRQLWECISSHTARRSFATNYYLQGFPTIDLMKITGHKTEKAFLKYIRVTKDDAAKRLKEHIKKQWSLKIMKIAS